MNYKDFLAQNAKRRKEIKALRAKKWTWRRIADKYDLSPQRVQQMATDGK